MSLRLFASPEIQGERHTCDRTAILFFDFEPNRFSGQKKIKRHTAFLPLRTPEKSICAIWSMAMRSQESTSLAN